MRWEWCAPLLILFWSIGVRAEAPVEIEIATERGVQITAPQEWLQLLTTLGARNVRLRSATRGDEPRLQNRGSDKRPRYHVLGILTARDQLLMPGEGFGRNDRGKLKDYLERLAADGAEGVTAPRGSFDLTERQFEVVHRDLSQLVDFSTAGRSLGEVLDKLDLILELDLAPQGEAATVIRDAALVADEAKGFSAGTALALMLRAHGLALRPEKPRGKEVVYQIVLLPTTTAKMPVGNDEQQVGWPVGWEPNARPRTLAPILFEFLSAEIDGYSLQEALDAIGPRIELPIFLDRLALKEHNIDPQQFQIKLQRMRTYYFRLLKLILFQARLRADLREDEMGKVFIWITR